MLAIVMLNDHGAFKRWNLVPGHSVEKQRAKEVSTDLKGTASPVSSHERGMLSKSETGLPLSSFLSTM